jgi:hypothetical protein
MEEYPASRKKPTTVGFNERSTPTTAPANRDGTRTSRFQAPEKYASRTKPKNNGSAIKDNSVVRPKKSEATERPEFDSTWFFPVGSDVVHGNFGRGAVLQPPPPGKNNELLVRVQFENGRTMEFPASGTDIVPDLGL